MATPSQIGTHPALLDGMRTLSAGSFHGAARKTMTLDGLTLAESEYAPGHRLPMHAHERPFFSLVLRGSFEERLERGSRRCVPTSLVFYPAHEPHAEAFGDQGGRAFNIELGGTWLKRVQDLGWEAPSASAETRRGRVNWLATRLYGWFVSGGNDIGAEEIVLEMLDEVGEERACDETPPMWLARVVELLHARYTEVLRVTELAEEAGVHPVHLARVFRRHRGCTIGAYVRRLRVEHACASLVDPEASLSTIALETGFSDQAHFTRRFKSLTGMPPGVYRRLVAQ